MGVNATRANLCELLALKVLRVYAVSLHPLLPESAKVI